MSVGEDRSAAQPRPAATASPARSKSIPITGRRHSSPAFSREPLEMYLNCPRCGLGIAQMAPSRPFVHCPRCLGRARARVELFASALRAEQLYPDGAPWANAGTERDTSGANPDDNHTDRARRPESVLLASATKTANP